MLVDSALEAVSRGSTTVGIKTSAFALLASHIKPVRPLIDPAEKIFAIDGHIGATGSGYIGDILQLIDELRLEAQKHRLNLESPIDVGSLTKHLGSFLHNYTVYAVRPQGSICDYSRASIRLVCSFIRLTPVGLSSVALGLQ